MSALQYLHRIVEQRNAENARSKSGSKSKTVLSSGEFFPSLADLTP